MNSHLRGCSLLCLTLFAASGAAACGGASDSEPSPQTAQPPPPPPPPPPPASEGAPLPEPYTQASPGVPPEPPAAPAPDSQPQAQAYPTGQWVYLAGQGWVWVPAGATTTDMEGVPYAYLYTPAYGWTWYVSPWGLGPYHYGVWVRHPWHPVGFHGYWVAHPHVTVRLGGRGRR